MKYNFKTMKIDNLIKLIENCDTYFQLNNLKNFIDDLEFDNVKDCRKVFNALTDKENKLR